MDKAKLAKYTTAAVMTTGMAIALPAVAPFVAPFILPLMTGILSESAAVDIGKSSVDAMKSILSNLASSAIWESPNPLGKNPENQDLLRLLVNAYLEAIKELDLAADEKLKEQADIILPLVQARLRKAVSTEKDVDLLELFPLNKDSEPGDLKYSFANRISSGELILEMADESFSEDKILADEIEISIRRWFSEEKTFQNQTATDLTTINLSTELIPEPLRSFLRYRLAKSIPQKIGELSKQPEFERSWIAFQRSHLQAILKEVKNKENVLSGQTALSEEDRKLLSSLTKLLSPLAKELDMLSKFEGVPEKIADFSQTCLIRFDNLETILENQQAKLLKAVSEGRRRLLEELENIKKQIQELEEQIRQGNLSLEEIKSELANQTKFLETLSVSFGDLDILKSLAAEIKRLSEKINSLPNSIPSVSGFVGRKDYLDDLRESYQNGTRCFVLHGIGGVGKTSLALEFANELAGEYAAKIFVDMQAMSENPLSWQTAMFEVVRQFEREVPADISEAQKVTHYVQFTQNQPTLIVLDNAANKESVERLMRAKACLIVTSRETFNLTGGIGKHIEKMSPNDARNLLFKIADEERFDEQADALAELAGYLPMALKPLASILAEDELETLGSLKERYKNKKKLLEERVPDYKNLTIEASFELSYEALPDEMKDHWRRLSVFPADFDEAAMAAVLNLAENEAKEAQKLLRKYSLLEIFTKSPPRFNLHDLAREFCDSKLRDDKRFETRFLFAKHYISVLLTARNLQESDSQNGSINASELIDAELNNIRTGQKWSAENLDKDNEIAELCRDYVRKFPNITSHFLTHELFIWLQAGLRACQKIGDLYDEGAILADSILYYVLNREYQKVNEVYERILKISREVGDHRNGGSWLVNEINTFGLSSIEFYEKNLKISRETGNRDAEHVYLFNLGLGYMRLGEKEKACNLWKEELVICESIESPYANDIQRWIEENCN